METPEKDFPPPPSEARMPMLLQFLFGFLPALFGGFVSLVFGIILCIYVVNRIAGEPPTPALINFFILWVAFGAFPLGIGVLVLWAWNEKDETKGKTPGRWFMRGVLAWLLFLLAVGFDTQCGPWNWRTAFSREPLIEGDVDKLKTTIVTPHLEAEIGRGTNVLWCGTFQLAWNEACKLAGGDLHFDQDHPMVAVLNKRTFTKDCLDEPSYVAMAGFVKGKIHERIRATVERHFHGDFKPRFVPDPIMTKTVLPEHFAAYACLYKNLAFPVPFERLDQPLTFGGVKVESFGMGDYKASHEKMYPQVLILDYASADDFVVELKSKSENDRIILAKVQSKATLADTVTSVRERIAHGEAEAAVRNDVLKVPRMKFDLFRRYSELEQRRLLPPSTNVVDGLYLTSAVQDTCFEMNEKGVELRSEAHMAFGCGKEHVKHWMVLDKPFLILLERTGAKLPYFVLWVDNAELLTPW